MRIHVAVMGKYIKTLVYLEVKVSQMQKRKKSLCH